MTNPTTLLADLPTVTPRHPRRSKWECANDNATGWRLIKTCVSITRIVGHGDQFRVELSNGDRLTVNGAMLCSPASLAKHIEFISGDPLGVPSEVESLAGWIPYVESLITAPEALNVS